MCELRICFKQTDFNDFVGKPKIYLLTDLSSLYALQFLLKCELK